MAFNREVAYSSTLEVGPASEILSKMALLSYFATEVNARDLPYEMLSQNSNSMARSFVKLGGWNMPGNLKGVCLPGIEGVPEIDAIASGWDQERVQKAFKEAVVGKMDTTINPYTVMDSLKAGAMAAYTLLPESPRRVNLPPEIPDDYKALTAEWFASQAARFERELLFVMPVIGSPMIVGFGAGSATPFIVRDMVLQRDHMRHQPGFKNYDPQFVLVGGKPLGKEDPRYTDFLLPRLEANIMPIPEDGSMRECDYAKQVLMEKFGIPEDKITIFKDDHSTNLQQNLEVLKAHGLDRQEALDMYTLSGTARRLLGTAKVVWPDSRTIMSAHNSYVGGTNSTNWLLHAVTEFYLCNEAAKVLPGPLGGRPLYEQAGFFRPVSVREAIMRVQDYIKRQAGPALRV